MTSNRRKTLACAVGASIALATTVAFAADAVKQSKQSSTAAPVIVAMAGMPISRVDVRATADAAFPPLQAGVRNAAAQGPTELRRYVLRTRMIYDYNYWDFATLLPEQ